MLHHSISHVRGCFGSVPIPLAAASSLVSWLPRAPHWALRPLLSWYRLWWGGIAGIIAGLSRGRLGDFILRAVDVIMSFPSLLMALIVLYVLGSAPSNIVIVLAVTRLPVYVRTARAEVLEIRERAFVSAAKVMGSGSWHIAVRHIAPLVTPTLLIIGALDFAYVMLAESALSFLGIGVQPPNITWGLMVADGRAYLNAAWWLAFWPGLAIMTTALATNLLAIWYRMANDPSQRSAPKAGAATNV